ncbi:MAG: ATP-dependent helicase [Methanobacteriota archaeon]|nr:MAG: ATP-dependent helicase [Euryarchaeota archaeon]
MTSRIVCKAGTKEVLDLLHPVIADWFRDKFEEVTEAQSMAVPLIHRMESVLVSSPTGSGKTLTAFLSIVNELTLLATEGQLEDRIYAVYVSPLKALANDINENLLKPLEELSGRFRMEGMTPPELRVAVRTGDTLQSERQKQARRPPHIFITTPESLALVLSTPVFRKKFEGVRYVIVDEVHEICDSKRGVSLSLSLERLQSICATPLVRIGLSATVAPIDDVAHFLAGVEDGRSRPMKVVEVLGQRNLDLSVICPADDMTTLSFEVVNAKMYDMLKEMIEQHRTTLIFTNTRSGTESVVYKLKERGLDEIGAHHGSLSRETRLEVEKSLRDGRLKAVVSSTSLELGIDIGSIDLVVQIGSPKSVAKGLQRIGRAGHQYGGTSKGRMIVFENDDLVECAVLARAAHRKAIDRVSIPMKSLDVLSQTIVGLSLERKWSVDDALLLLRRSYCYRELTKEELVVVLEYLGGKGEFEGVYSKVWFDEDEEVFGRKRGSRMIYYLNQGTIPEEADYKVFSERGTLVGSLSEKFVERLSKGDIFVLGGRSYEFLRSKGMKALVRSASGRKPTVPSWTGEMLPRSFDLSVMVAEFREEMDLRLETDDDERIRSWLMNEFHVDEGSANTITNYFREQKSVGKIPSNSRLVVEGYVDQSGNRSAIFHFPFGRRVNDALSRAYAAALSERVKGNVTVSISDDSFMLTSPMEFELDDLASLVTASALERRLRDAVRDSELFIQRFRHVATRSFMVLRNYKGKELSVGRQQLRSRRLLDALHELDSFPVMMEAFNEILTEVMDVESAMEVLLSIERQEREVETIPYSSVPSPFAHNIILLGVSDIVLMEDKSMLLRSLHRRVIERALGEDAATAYRFTPEEVERYFKSKSPQIDSKSEMISAIRVLGPLNIFREKGDSIYSRSTRSFDMLNEWAHEALREGEVRSVWIGEDVYVHADHHDLYTGIHLKSIDLTQVDESALGALAKRALTVNELARSLHQPLRKVKERVRRLEVANLVYRSDMREDAPLYRAVACDCDNSTDAVAGAVRRHLAYHAPISLEDIAYEVGISEDDAKHALDFLTARDAVASGPFIVGEQLQYMLTKDYLQLSWPGEAVFDRDTVRAFKERKQFQELDSIGQFFDRFGSAGMAYDIAQRVKGFDIGDFYDVRRNGSVLLGRFVKGRVRYLQAEDVPHYLAFYREGRLNKYERAVLQALERNGSGTYQDIAEWAGLPASMMRESFDAVDRKGFLLREFDEAEHWSSRNTYTICSLQPEPEGAAQKVVTHLLRGQGPITAYQAATQLAVEEAQARRMLFDAGASMIRVGLDRVEMYVHPEELAEIEAVTEGRDSEPSTRILSLYDPFLSDRWPEISATYGEGWIYPVVRGADMIGMIESWLMAAALDVRDIRLQDRAFLGGLVEALDRSMTFYNALGVDVLRISSVLGSEIDSLEEDVIGEFTSRGFSESNGMFVKGSLVVECFDRETLLSTIFTVQSLGSSEKMADINQAFDRFGALRSDSEVMLRVDKREQLASMLRGGAVVKGHIIPERVGYCRPADAGLFRAARSRELTEDESTMLRIIADQGSVRRDKLLALSPVGPERSMEALKALYHSSHAFIDGSHNYVLAKKRKFTREGAWMAVIKRLFDVYGIARAETIGALLGGDLRMRELRSILRQLERRGHLVKGHLLRGSTTMFWASKRAYGLLEDVEFDSSFVLSPEDNLYHFLRASDRELIPPGGRFAVFKGPEPVGSFAGRLRGGTLEIGDIEGGQECSAIIDEYARLLSKEHRTRQMQEASDWEIMEFYEKSHPGMG